MASPTRSQTGFNDSGSRDCKFFRGPGLNTGATPAGKSIRGWSSVMICGGRELEQEFSVRELCALLAALTQPGDEDPRGANEGNYYDSEDCDFRGFGFRDL